MKTSIFAAAMAILPFIGCADAPDVANEEPLAFQVGKADGASADNWTYFRVSRQDTRRCVSPLCGGVYLKRLNQAKTKCADGIWATECYVGGFDLKALGLTDDQASDVSNAAHAAQVIVRGEIVTGYYPGDFAYVPAFRASEAWIAATNKAPGATFYRVVDTGLRCITSPCESYEGTKLNKNANPIDMYAGVNLRPSGASDDAIAYGFEELQGAGLIMAATRTKVTGPAGTSYELKASQFYVKVVGEGAVTGQACGGRVQTPCPEGTYCQFPTELCGKADGQGTCETQPAVCTEEYEPVCGCDGVTYANDCYRKEAGAGFGTPGECAAPCKTSGCGGEVCIAADAENHYTMCMVRPTDVCYQDYGVCEPQADGVCGWTPSEKLQGCLDAVTP